MLQCNIDRREYRAGRYCCQVCISLVADFVANFALACEGLCGFRDFAILGNSINSREKYYGSEW